VESAIEWLIASEDRPAKRWLWEMQLERAMQAYFELDRDQSGAIECEPVLSRTPAPGAYVAISSGLRRLSMLSP
jgi:hypothetical protein